MLLARDIRVEPISAKTANEVIAVNHYSGKVVPNSQIHLGVFLGGRCGGAMQFGPSMDKSKTIGLVRDTKWHDFIELNRMAFADWLPRNSESRALGVAMRLIKKTYPNIEWVISFADATKCGDGTIYRASGFVLTGIKENRTILEHPDGRSIASMTVSKDVARMAENGGAASVKALIDQGFAYRKGFMLRYMYFLNKAAVARLTVPIVPFSAIGDSGATMYKGKRPDDGYAVK